MSRPSVCVRAPSNIALVKYMGKLDGSQNLPANPSLSMTLDSLCTIVEVSESTTAGAKWIPEAPRIPAGADLRHPPQVPELSTAAADKFVAHVARFVGEAPALYAEFGIASTALGGGIELRSANTFPHSSGIASSASSFAALTFALFLFFSADRAASEEHFRSDARLRAALARISRKGSGSSCRSFFGPFCEWNGEEVRAVSSQLPPLADLVCLLSSAPKAVSSSEAHRRVMTSPLWVTRTESVLQRFSEVKAAIGSGNFACLAPLVVTEAKEMHELFHTAAEPFGYLTPESKKLLAELEAFLGSRALLTLDAGPNIHILVPVREKDEVLRWLKAHAPAMPVLEDGSSEGPLSLGGQR